MKTPSYTPNDLRNASIDYLAAHATPDDDGHMSIVTPGGLAIEYKPGSTTIRGAVYGFGINDPADVEHAVVWNYGDPTSPHVTRINWGAEGKPKLDPVNPIKHRRVASGLMALLLTPEALAEAS